jgi:hypothetical protein
MRGDSLEREALGSRKCVQVGLLAPLGSWQLLTIRMLADVGLHAHGYRTLTSKPGHHQTAIQSLPTILGVDSRVECARFTGCAPSRTFLEASSAYRRTGCGFVTRNLHKRRITKATTALTSRGCSLYRTSIPVRRPRKPSRTQESAWRRPALGRHSPFTLSSHL